MTEKTETLTSQWSVKLQKVDRFTAKIRGELAVTQFWSGPSAFKEVTFLL